MSLRIYLLHALAVLALVVCASTAARADITISDASVSEPPSGTTRLTFTVALTSPATSNVTVNFTTADEPAGAGKAVAGADYTTTAGTLTFTPGQTVQTISVPVLHDNDSPEPDETFLVQLSGAVGGVITDGTATGTITAANPEGAIIISELRTFGPDGAGDDFVEVYNNTGTPHTVSDGSGINDAAHGYGLYRMGATCADTPVLVGVIPNGTVIPARGHYLFTGSQYSLDPYATGDQAMTTDIAENGNVGLFSTVDAANLSTATRLDAVGFDNNMGGNNCDLLREGNALPAVNAAAAGLAQHSYYRSHCSFVEGVGCTTPNPGSPSDRNDNAIDFLFVDTNATNAAGASQHRLGAPGPENLASPRVTNNVGAFLLDGTKSSSAVPNRVRNTASDPANNSTFGTMSFRKRFTNNTGGSITQLRFRIVEVTTFPSANAALADLRARSSAAVMVSGVTDPATCAANGTPATPPCTVTVRGTTLEEPPTQPMGGAYNSSLAAGTITLQTPLANNASISVQFLFGVQQAGTFRFLLNVEALP